MHLVMEALNVSSAFYMANREIPGKLTRSKHDTQGSSECRHDLETLIETLPVGLVPDWRHALQQGVPICYISVYEAQVVWPSLHTYRQTCVTRPF